MRINFSNPWFIPDRPPICPDVLVIPSYALKSRTLPTSPTRAQIELAYQWWQKFPRAKIIMSTGDNQNLGVTNAHVMIEYAIRLGVPRDNLIEEDRSKNTWENLYYSLDIIKAQRLTQPTLVTLDLYTRRAVATARKMGWQDYYWLSVYSKGEPAYGTKRFQTYSRFTIFAYELTAMLYSKFAGWV
ncbi:MAG: YdcF family protein [Chloroflexi bacterium]|nr:YdcF family protein [Chloroflexota bacterium]